MCFVPLVRSATEHDATEPDLPPRKGRKTPGFATRRSVAIAEGRECRCVHNSSGKSGHEDSTTRNDFERQVS